MHHTTLPLETAASDRFLELWLEFSLLFGFYAMLGPPPSTEAGKLVHGVPHLIP